MEVTVSIRIGADAKAHAPRQIDSEALARSVASRIRDGKGRGAAEPGEAEASGIFEAVYLQRGGDLYIRKTFPVSGSPWAAAEKLAPDGYYLSFVKRSDPPEGKGGR